MPANLTPDYHRAEERLRAAKTVDEKIAALEEMLRVCPKHKGTDGLVGDLKSRIAKLRKQPVTKAARAGHAYHVTREGAGQVALAGAANTGKSSLVAALTHAAPDVADYPGTTREPVPGMMAFDDVGIQLVDLPPLSEEHVEPWVYDIVRGADLLWLVVDGMNPMDELDLARRMLDAKNIGVFAAGEPAPAEGPAGRAWKPALVVVTGLDKAGAEDGLPVLEEWLESAWPVVPVSTADGRGLDALRRRTFVALDVIRVYTKQPGKPADRRAPFTLPRGSRVSDLAARIHKDLASGMKFARIWGPSAFDGQTVHGEHVLAEGDVVEIHV